jgi:hypothetical protein
MTLPLPQSSCPKRLCFRSRHMGIVMAIGLSEKAMTLSGETSWVQPDCVDYIEFPGNVFGGVF